jgi:hypothetical protein
MNAALPADGITMARAIREVSCQHAAASEQARSLVLDMGASVGPHQRHPRRQPR